MEDRETMKSSLYYFWTEKEDLTRYCFWEDAKKEFPLVKDAWEKYKTAEKYLSFVIKELIKEE